VVCPTCQGKKLIPFVKNGRVIPNAYQDCPDCYQEPVEHYQQLRAGDFDFACSDSWRGFYHERYEGHDPGFVPEPPPPPMPLEQIIVHRHSNMGKQEYDLLQQTARKLDWLEKKVTEKKKREDYY
jgi:hypothetical protein